MNIYTRNIICILLVFVPIANTVFAISYTDPLKIDSHFRSVPQQSITEASLLETYIKRYQNKINDTYSSYSSQDSTTIRSANRSLISMSKVLKKIQEESVNPDEVDEIMTSIIYDLKVLNRRIKIYLQQKRDIFDENLLQKRKQYNKIGLQISQILDTLISSQTQRLVKISNLSEKEKNLIVVLVNIQKENEKIKKFNTTNFESEEQMKIYFQNIIKNIRLNVQNLRKYL